MTTDTNAAPLGGDDEDNLIDDATMTEMEATPPLSKEPDQVADDTPPADDTAVADDDTDDAALAAAADDGKTKFVPHKRFNKTYQDLQEQRRTNSVLEQRTNQLLGIVEQFQRAQQPAQPEQQMPQVPTDPLEKIEFLSNWYEQSQQQFQQEAIQRQEQDQQRSQVQRIVDIGKQDYNERVAIEPEYAEAYDFVVKQRQNELQAMGFQGRQLAAHMGQYELALAHQAISRNGRPSDLILGVAQARGWQKKAPEPQPDPAAQEQRREQHLSLSQMGGKAGRGSLTAKDLANMDEDAFAKLKDSVVSGLMGA